MGAIPSRTRDVHQSLRSTGRCTRSLNDARVSVRVMRWGRGGKTISRKKNWRDKRSASWHCFNLSYVVALALRSCRGSASKHAARVARVCSTVASGPPR